MFISCAARGVGLASVLGVFSFLGVARADVAPLGYQLAIVAAPAQKGKPTVATVKIVAAATYHMNKEFPTSLVLTPPSGIAIAKVKFNASDAKLDEKSAEFTVSFTPAEAGNKEIPGELKFAVCTVDTCIPHKVKVGIQTTTK